jgi:hypothetical protein
MEKIEAGKALLAVLSVGPNLARSSKDVSFLLENSAVAPSA